MDLVELFSAALGVAVLSFTGRGVLAWLPPGDVGAHRPAALPATWASSYLLGCVFFALGACVAALLGVPVSSGWIAAAGALLGLTRRATLPAALVPRHEVLHERPRRAARFLFALALLLALARAATATIDAGSGLWAVRAQAWLSQGWLLGFDGPRTLRGALDFAPFDPGAIACLSWAKGSVGSLAARWHLLACFLAALVLTERALGVARVAPLGRSIFLVLLALALAPAVAAEDGDLSLAALCALGMQGIVAWTRRADRRGLALACIAWSALVFVRPSGCVLAGAGLAATLATTARPAFRTAARWTIAGALVASLWPLAAWTRSVALLGPEPLESISSGWAVEERLRVALLVGPLWIVAGAGIGPAFLKLARARGVAAEGPRRDLAALLFFGGLLGILAASVVALYEGSTGLFARAWAPGLLVQAAPFAAVLAARSLVRVERTD